MNGGVVRLVERRKNQDQMRVVMAPTFSGAEARP